MLTSHPKQMRHARGTAQRLGTSWSSLLGILLALSGGSSQVYGEEGKAAPAAPGHDAHASASSPAEDAASHGAADAPAEVAHGSAHDAHSDAAHAFHSNHAALFLGATVGTEGLFPSLGVEYERRLGMFGVTAFGEFTAATTPFLILGAGVVLHPFGQLRLMALAGAEISLGAAETTEDVTHRVQVQAEGSGAAAPLARLGAAYDFHLGKISLSPSFFVDYAHEHFTTVGGLGIGMGF